MKKYIVIADTENTMLIQRSAKTFINKSDALEYANDLYKSGVPVNINIDTYSKGICIKNEFGRFDGCNINIYDIIVYNKPIQKQVFKYNPNDFFNEFPSEIRCFVL